MQCRREEKLSAGNKFSRIMKILLWIPRCSRDSKMAVEGDFRNTRGGDPRATCVIGARAVNQENAAVVFVGDLLINSLDTN